MKELSIEEKAKRYDEALTKARNIVNSINVKLIGKDSFESVFPELKESEDEQIRKELIQYFSTFTLETFAGLSPKKIIAWLEKQDEQKPQGKSALEAANEEKVDNQNCVKPTDKVEPKFKVGDFIVNDYCMGKVIELTDDAYLLDTGQGIPFSCEHNIHLWTIQDAKDGDVLSYRDGQWCFIYKGIVTEDTFKYYALLSEKGITVNDAAFSLLSSCITPATKEQRDLLFQKIHEAGYEWNSEKKELGKIEQKPAWSEADEGMLNFVKVVLNKHKNDEFFDKFETTFNDCLMWFRNIKSRVGCEMNCTTMWKPSDEQMEALEFVIKSLDEMLLAIGHMDNVTKPRLKEVLEELKKLKKE